MLLQILELALLASFTLPFLRVATRRSTLRTFPRVSAVLIGCAVLWVGTLVVLAVWLPALLHGITIVSVVTAAAAIWMTRPGYGRSKRLPPGSFGLPTSIGAIVDRRFYLRQAERHGPVFKMVQFHQPVACVVGLERGHRLLRDHRKSMGPSVLPLNRDVSGGFLRYMDDSTHAVYGPLFRQALLGRVMEEARSTTEGAVSQELARAVAEAETRTGGGASVAPDPVLSRFVLTSFLRALFGVTPDDPWFERLTSAYRPLADPPLSAAMTESQKASLSDLRTLLAQLSEEQRTDNDTGGPTSTLSELARLSGGTPDDVCLDNLFVILKIATGNVAGLLRWLLVTLGSHPEWIDKVREELDAPATISSPKLSERIVMETLRLSQSEYLYRRAQRQVEFDGFRVPKGWLVRVCVWESHRSPETFREPEVFDPDRFLDRDFPPSAYSPFGTGPHACNGVPLANLISTIFVERLCREYDWSVEGHDPPVRRLRHWEHWRPNPKLRLLLAPVSA